MRIIFRLMLLCLLLSGCAKGISSSPLSLTKNKWVVSEPVLRIETVSHNSNIGNISLDAAEKTLVTCSKDKTIRVWNLATGELNKVIRVPVGEESHGELFAVALSPDGKTIAAGGFDNRAGIFIIDLASGEIRNRIRHRNAKYRGSIFHLAFSKDGRYLAAGMYKKGLIVFRTDTWKSVAHHGRADGYNTDWVDFAPDGRLVTASYDGFIRVFDSDFKPMIKRKILAGQKPQCVAFSPDGRKIAVAFRRFDKIQVLSASDLSLLYEPDTSGVPKGNPQKVAWSSDGQRLMAAGRWWQNSGGYPIRIWGNGGQGDYTDLMTSSNTVTHLIGLKNGGVVYSSLQSAWGIFNRDGKQVIKIIPKTVNYLGRYKDLRISQDGMIISAASKKDNNLLLFNVNERVLNKLPLAKMPSEMKSSITKDNNHTFSNWQYSQEPNLNGNKIELKKREQSLSLSIAPDSKHFLLGTGWYLRCYTRTGSTGVLKKWMAPVTGSFAVNISGDNKLAVAALGDGTIRWYSMTDGKELLALFIHKDTKRWVMWTPSGYYAASAGGEDLIGWHINHGWDQTPDFFPASRFRSVYYRPDVTANILSTLDEDEALRLANLNSGKKATTAAIDIKKLSPPVVTILAPMDNHTVTDASVSVSYSIRNPSGEPLTSLKVLIDGRPVHQLRQTGAVPLSGLIDVQVPQKADFKISLIAENRNAVSVARTVSLHRVMPSPQKVKASPSVVKKPVEKKSAPAKKPSVTKTTPAKKPSVIKTAPKPKAPKAAKGDFLIKPKLYLLAIGVSNYHNKDMSLAYAVKDARDMAKILKRQEGFYREVDIKLLADPTKDQVLIGLEWLERETTDKDVAMIFLAGHGINDRNGNYYFLPAEGTLESLKRTGIPYHEIKNTISGLPGKVLAFIDTCHAGGVMGKRLRGIAADIDRIANDLASAENGVVVFASSTGRQSAVEDDKWRNGAFTKALVEGLSGKADYSKNSVISINELDLYISERVKELTKGSQTPTTTKPTTIQDFPIAVTLKK